MNKKQKNRKIVQQNKRNRMVNRRYSSTIKSLTKLFKNKTNTDKKGVESVKEGQTILSSLYSILDKAVKKQVIHKNTAARKKSKLTRNLAKVISTIS